MKIPRKIAKRMVWLLGLTLWIIHPFIMISYFEVTQRLRWYPSDGDSIGIPIIGGFINAVIGLPFLIILCLRASGRVTGSLNVFEWDDARRWRSAVTTAIFGLFAFVSIQSLYFSYELLQEIEEAQLHEYRLPTLIRMALSVGWITFWILIRGCFVTPKHAEQNAAEKARSRLSCP